MVNEEVALSLSRLATKLGPEILSLPISFVPTQTNSGTGKVEDEEWKKFFIQGKDEIGPIYYVKVKRLPELPEEAQNFIKSSWLLYGSKSYYTYDIASTETFLSSVNAVNGHRAIAYTNRDGIFLSDSILEYEPHNVEVYLAHEIFHHVVHEEEKTGKYPHSVVNCAEDYKINQLLLELFGYDVKAVNIEGIRAKKYYRKSIVEIAEDLQTQETGYRGCGSRGVAHPSLIQVAQQIRHKFRDVLEAKVDRLFYIDKMDEKIYSAVVNVAWEQIDYLRELSMIDSEKVINGLWSHLYLDKPKAKSIERSHLTGSETLAYAFPGKMYRQLTMKKPADAMLSAVLFLRKADQDAMFIASRIESICTSIKFVEELIEKKRKREKVPKAYLYVYIPELKRRLKALRQRLIKWRQMRPLHALLKEVPVVVHPEVKRVPRGSFRPVSVASAFQEPQQELMESVKLPNFDDNETTDQIYRVARRGYREFKTVMDVSKEIAHIFGDSQVEGLGDTQGDGPGLVKRMELLLTLSHHIDSLTNIFFYMQEIESLFSRKTTRKLSEIGLETSYTYGNDLELVEASEFALLARPETRLEFFVRYSNHSLLLRSPPQQQRYPVCICLDGSGSMKGERYQMAAGFALAVMKQLYQDRRGVAIMTFSSDVTKEVIVHSGHEIEMKKIFDVLCSPSFGGTDFDRPLERAYQIKEQEKWKNMVTILVSDGEGTIQAEPYFAKKHKHDKLIAALVSKHTKGVEGIADEIFITEKHDMKLQLVKIANAVI